MLEQQLVGQASSPEARTRPSPSRPDGAPPSLLSWDHDELLPLVDFGSGFPDLTGLDSAGSPYIDLRSSGLLTSDGGEVNSLPASPSSRGFLSRLQELNISSLMRADLDQLYFDRVHPVLPILHKQRYLSWARQEDLSPPRVCLRLTMWALATAASAQSSHLEQTLCTEARRGLEQLDANLHREQWTTGRTQFKQLQIENVQAWLLLAHYDFLRVHKEQAMLTAERAFRLVQLLQLDRIDSPSDTTVEGSGMLVDGAPSLRAQDETFIEAEEKRRAFWLAYCFDRLVAIYMARPVRLHDELICTRLPVPEADFQDAKPVRMEFLSAATCEASQSRLCPFAECIVLVTIYSRCVIHRGLAMATMSCTAEAKGFWARHTWLATVVERRLQLLMESPSTASALIDPLLAFTHVLAHSIIIHLSVTSRLNPWQKMEYQLMEVEYEQRAFRASDELVRLAKATPQLSCFKAHPFLPCAIAHAAGFLRAHAQGVNIVESPDERQQDLREFLVALENLKEVNQLAQEVLRELERDPS
ncbi:fungal-specific transcription factor domain-containing protein [Aspergillus recurvatus]